MNLELMLYFLDDEVKQRVKNSSIKTDLQEQASCLSNRF
ncbi:hypothetical protein VCSRO93_2346 [Vibrio cholerae]|nr:hypothetical protein VCSRO93_2346 [Vibrio cholerae]